MQCPQSAAHMLQLIASHTYHATSHRGIGNVRAQVSSGGWNHGSRVCINSSRAGMRSKHQKLCTLYTMHSIWGVFRIHINEVRIIPYYVQVLWSVDVLKRKKQSCSLYTMHSSWGIFQIDINHVQILLHYVPLFPYVLSQRGNILKRS